MSNTNPLEELYEREKAKHLKQIADQNELERLRRERSLLREALRACMANLNYAGTSASQVLGRLEALRKAKAALGEE